MEIALLQDKKISASIFASGSIHLLLFGWIGGFSLRPPMEVQPIALDYVSVASSAKPAQIKPKALPIAPPTPEQNQVDSSLSEPSKASLSANPLRSAQTEVSSNSPNQLDQTLSSSETQATAQALSARELYISKLTQLLNARKNYPEISRKMRQQGRIKVRFLLERDGRILNSQVVQPSQFDPLNQAAQSLLNEIKNFEPFPTEIRDQEWAVTVPIEYVM